MKKCTLIALIIQFFFLFNSSIYAGEPLKVVSYNLGLAHTFVPLAKERLPHLIEKLKDGQADVLCLQEVWTKKDRKAIVKSLKPFYPYSQKLKIKQKRSRKHPTCKFKNVFGEGKFIQCLQKDCKGKKGDEFTACIIKKCRGALERLKVENSDCAQGILSQVGKTTLQAMLAVFNPFYGAGLFSYKGSDGLLILSKYELYDQKTIELDHIATGSRRRVLLSSMKVGAKEVTVGCTHLTANLSRSVPYTGEFTGWATENLAQVKELIKQTKHIQKPLILAGDYNCSIKDQERGIKSEFSKSCEYFMEQGFADHYYKENAKCTFCENNTLVKKSKTGDNNFVLDHIFVKNTEVVSSELIFDELVTLEKKSKLIESNLSDHFGVLLDFDL